MKIRGGAATDLPIVDQILIEDSEFHVALEPKWMTSTTGISSSDWEQYLTDADKDALVYELDGEVFGVVLLSVGKFGDPGMEYQPYGVVDEIAVTERHRDQGIGRKLMAAAEAWAKSRGIKALLLDVWKRNERAIALYEKVGYQAHRQRMFKAI
ncbi:MAG: GNAT family N-acetyltransferase [Gammaproteobacteria bacterium]|nr:GNAT family N-acetyltransferase [Gammaproteobacteria bacterium]